MKLIKFIRMVLIILTLAVFSSVASAQDTKVSDSQSTQQPAKQDIRATALRQLGLTKEQIQEIRRINVARKPLMEEAQKRFREANRLLDEAIYSDEIIEGDFQSRLKNVELAQAEVARIRFMNEFAVRRILSPEQLIRFRELRQRFEQTRDELKTRQPVRTRMQNRIQNNNVLPLSEVRQQLKANKGIPKQ